MTPRAGSLWIAGVILLGASAAGMAKVVHHNYPIATSPTHVNEVKRSVPHFAGVHISTLGTLPVPKEGIALAADGNAVFSVGGYTGTYSTSSVFQVVPNIKQQATLPEPNHDAAAGFIHHNLYVFGGGQATSYPYVTRVYGATASHLTDLAAPLSDAVCVPIKLNGQSGLVLLGGYDGSTFRTTATFYTENSQGKLQSKPLFQLKTGVRYAAVATDHQDIWIAGGLMRSGNPSNTIYQWSPQSGLRKIGTLPVAVQKAAAFEQSGNLIVAGGYNGSNQALNTIWDMNLPTHKVKQIGSLPVRLADMGYTQVGRFGYLLGGSTDTTVQGQLYKLSLS